MEEDRGKQQLLSKADPCRRYFDNQDSHFVRRTDVGLHATCLITGTNEARELKPFMIPDSSHVHEH